MCDKPVATFYGWMPNGVKTTIPVPLDGTPDDFDRILNYQNMFLSRGFVLDDPAFGKLDAGEKREKINGILRRKDQKNDDNTTSPTFDLYPDNPALGRRVVIINLDSAEDTAEFEKITGYKVSDFKIYTESQLNRKDNPSDYTEYAKPVRGNVSVVYKDNPKYDPNPKDGKRKRQYYFVRWEVATPPPPPAAPAPAVGNPSPAADDQETAERRKAVTALDNEELTVYSIHYNAQHNGQGHPRWEAMARITDGASVPLVIWTEHETLIKKAGYDCPRDAEDLAIPVLTAMVGSERHITAVKAIDGSWMALEPKTAEKGVVDGNSGNPEEYPAWLFDRVKLLYQIGQSSVGAKFPHEERANTIDKMHKAGEFDKVSHLESAVIMVINRLASHRKEKVPA